MAELLSESITTKVTEDELKRYEAAAKAEGLTVSEWNRTILRRVAPPPVEVTILAEILTVRRLQLNGPKHLQLFDAVKERDARLIFAGKPLPIGEGEAP